MDFNLKCNNLRSEIIKNINESNLPIAVIYYMFQSLYIEIENTYFKTINQIQLKQQKKSTEKELEQNDTKEK